MFVGDPDYTLGLWGELKRSAAYTGRLLRRCLLHPLMKVCLGLGLLFVLFFSALGPIAPGNKYTWTGAQMGRAHTIGVEMLAYAANHDGKFPDGNSSTEVFQKLLDQGYIYDPGIFYFRLPGKRKAISGKTLKPENVCYDITASIDTNDSDFLPVVFMTGFKVIYTAGSTAHTT